MQDQKINIPLFRNAGHMVSACLIILYTKFPPNLAVEEIFFFILLTISWVSNLGKIQLGSSIFGVSHVVAFRCHLGLTFLKV